MWHVEVWEQRGQQRYRVLRDGGPWADVGHLESVRIILAEDRIDLGDLIED